MYTGVDRRVDPRADTRIAVEVVTSPKEGEEMETLNLSSSGALCRSTRFLPLNSMVLCRLRLPGAGGVPPRTIETGAIVLRVNSSPDRTHIQVTFYFVDMKPEDREALRRFVFQCLQEGGELPTVPLPIARKA